MFSRDWSSDVCSSDLGEWPSDWPAPPDIAHIHGIELMPRDVERAQAALKNHATAAGRASFEAANMCTAAFPASDRKSVVEGKRAEQGPPPAARRDGST